MMDTHIKERWVRALRSGRYEQIDGTLRLAKTEGGYAYCCLGVLVDIVPDTKWYKVATTDTYGYEYGAESTPAILGPLLRACVGLDVLTMNKLINMNDNGDPFPVIADYIERVA